MNTFGHYCQMWVNRRCRRAWMSGRTKMYYYHYRESWRRWNAACATIPPLVFDEVTFTMTNTDWRSE